MIPSRTNIRDIYRKYAVQDPAVLTMVQSGVMAIACFEPAARSPAFWRSPCRRRTGTPSSPSTSRRSRTAHDDSPRGRILAYFARVDLPGGNFDYRRRNCREFPELEQAHVLAFADALEELKSGRPEMGWARWVFPRPRNFGMTPDQAQYAIADTEEAADMLLHPVLGKNVKNAARALLGWAGTTPRNASSDSRDWSTSGNRSSSLQRRRPGLSVSARCWKQYLRMHKGTVIHAGTIPNTGSATRT